MPTIHVTESPKNSAKVLKGIMKRRSFTNNSDIILISPRSITATSPRSTKAQQHEEFDYGQVNAPNDSSFMTKLKESFTVCSPMESTNDVIDQRVAKNAEKAKEGKRLSPLQARALSEYGAHLSEEGNDHQGAIVTLMRVSSKDFLYVGLLLKFCNASVFFSSTYIINTCVTLVSFI